MTKDFAKLERPQEKEAAVKKNKKPLPLWVIFLGLLMILNIIVMLYKNENQMKPVTAENETAQLQIDHQIQQSELSTTVTPASNRHLETETDGDILDDEPKETETVVSYDFYKKLPEVKVLDEIKVTSVKTKAAQKTIQIIEQTEEKAPVNLSNNGYLLQVASFRKVSDAERLMTRLKEAGFSSVYIQEVMIKEQDWHRVMLGKFNTFEEMQSKRQGLKLMGLETLLITVKN